MTMPRKYFLSMRNFSSQNQQNHPVLLKRYLQQHPSPCHLQILRPLKLRLCLRKSSIGIRPKITQTALFPVQVFQCVAQSLALVLIETLKVTLPMPTSISVTPPDPDGFVVKIPGRIRNEFANRDPENYYLGKDICVTGFIKKGPQWSLPMISVEKPTQIE